MKFNDLLVALNTTTNKKRKFIRDVLQNNKNWKMIMDNDYFMLFSNFNLNSVPDSVILISSHIDSVYKKFFVEVSDDKIIGTLDNSITNAIILDMMLKEELLENNNILISFTDREEIDCRGAEETIIYIKENMHLLAGIDLVIVLDVSAKNYDRNISLENFFIQKYNRGNNLRFESVSHMINWVENIMRKRNISYGIITEDIAEEDESWMYDEFDLNVLSLCIPVNTECIKDKDCDLSICYNGSLKEHCSKGITTGYLHISKYRFALKEICNELKTIVSRQKSRKKQYYTGG